MRYRAGEIPEQAAYAGTSDFVTFTVFLTLLIGVGFLVIGLRAGQRWLAIWGGLTIVACTIYAVVIARGLLG